jgi:aspartate kinase
VIVCKFGGTSVGDAVAIRRTAGIVRSRLPSQPIVVVSALGGATNVLIAIAEQAARGQLIGALRAVQNLRERHLKAAEALLGADTADGVDLADDLSGMFDELASLAEALSVLGHLTPRSLDTVSALGEQFSSLMCAVAFRHLGVPSEHVDARRIMVTDDQFTRAEPQVEAIADAAREILLPIVKRGAVPVMGGYIGSTIKGGITTTLGRGGSDYSASLIGAALKAEAIEIWTDVDGMLTADPRIVPAARTIAQAGFEEAAELASFGAKVLHPYTIAPAVRIGIPVSVLNSHNPDGRGTVITFDAPRRPVTAIAGKSAVTMVKVRSPRMLLNEGFLRELFAIFERHRTSVDVVATSEVSVSLTIDDGSHLEELVGELRELGDVAIERDRGIVAVVGAGMSESSDAMSRALRCIGGIRLHMLSLSATGINLTMVVDGDEVNPLMQRLHAEFFESTGDARV